MNAVSDAFRPFSAELHTIRRLNCSLHRTADRDGPDPRFHSPAEHIALASSQYDVALLDPCTSQLTAGVELQLGLKGPPKFMEFPHVASCLWMPPGFRERPHEPMSNPSGICE